MLPRELRILDKNKLMRFEIPRSLRRMLSEQNRTLKIIDKHQFGVTNFYPQATYENPNPKSHFDFSIWKIRKSKHYSELRGKPGGMVEIMIHQNVLISSITIVLFDLDGINLFYVIIYCCN